MKKYKYFRCQYCGRGSKAEVSKGELVMFACRWCRKVIYVNKKLLDKMKQMWR